jgi:hypothetical protein
MSVSSPRAGSISHTDGPVLVAQRLAVEITMREIVGELGRDIETQAKANA